MKKDKHTAEIQQLNNIHTRVLETQCTSELKKLELIIQIHQAQALYALSETIQWLIPI